MNRFYYIKVNGTKIRFVMPYRKAYKKARHKKMWKRFISKERK